MNTMKAAVVTKPGEIRMQEIPVPEIASHEVLIKVKICGICGTDHSIYSGKYSRDRLPLVAGHEFSGIVARAGKDVSGFQEGDPVTADINLGCEECFYCLRGQKLTCPQFHQLGIHTNGAFAEYVKAPASQIHRLPDGLDFTVGAFIEPVSCTIHAAKAMDVTLGSSVVVLGDGALGILHTQLAKLRGAAPVILVGMIPERLKAAEKMGVDYIIDIKRENTEQRVKELTGGRGGDFVIEAVGMAKTYEQAFRLVRPGGRVAAFGITDVDDLIQVKPFDFVLGELSMVGSCAGVGNDWPDAIALLQYGRIDPRPLFSMKVPLEELEKALAESKNNPSLIKIFVSPEITAREIF
ncbi:MAG TPA: alcohol dehydrogenase catalytic domain-containing protein [Atribacteraceae bacterium]|nr:alcohol dehydrogenase catalytic domain-containing protein [Atribacteraceae bacterium]